MSSQHPKLNSFDTRLFIPGGSDQAPQGSLRVATGTAAIRTRSVQSRPGSSVLYPVDGISITEYQGDFYIGDSAGNLYHNGSVLTTGFSGNRIAFAQAPPQVGLLDYLFVADGSKMVKVDPSNNVTGVGIAPPPNGFVVTALQSTSQLTTIHDYFSNDSTTVYWSYANSTIDPGLPAGNVLVNFPGDFTYANNSIGIPSELTLKFDARGDWRVTTTPAAPLNLALFADGSESRPSDLITFWVYTIGFPVVWGLRLAFNVGTPVSGIGTGTTPPTAFSDYLYANITLVNAATADSLFTYQLIQPGVAGTWQQISIPKSLFIANGNASTATSWQNVTQISLESAYMDHNSADFSNGYNNGIAVALLQMKGASGASQNGVYQYAVTFLNGTTGSRSNPNGSLPIDSTGTSGSKFPEVTLESEAAQLSNLPISSDAQVTAREIWRTSAGGAQLNFLDVIDDNVTTTYKDIFTDTPVPYTTNEWVAAASYTVGALVDGGNGYYFRCISPGTSGVNVPNWIVPPGNFIGPWKATRTYTATDWVSFTDQNCYIATQTLFGSGQAPPGPGWQLATTTTDGPQVSWKIQGINQLPLLGTVPNLTTPLVLEFDNTQPSPLFNDWVIWEGMSIWINRAGPNKRRIHYSPPGRPESVAGFVTVDDYCQRLCVYDNALFLFTSQNIYQGVLVPATTPGDDPSITFNEIGAGAGTVLPYTIVPTPIGILYAVPKEGLYMFTSAGAFPFASDAIITILRGETSGPYGPFNPVWAAYARGEFFISDGTQTYACMISIPGESVTQTSIPGTWRAIGLGLKTIFYARDKSLIVASFGGNVLEFETAGVNTDAGNPIQFVIQPPSINLNEGMTTTVQRAYIDYASFDSLTPTFLIDNTSMAITTLLPTNGARTITEIPIQLSGKIVDVSIAGALTMGTAEVFSIEWDLWTGK